MADFEILAVLKSIASSLRVISFTLGLYVGHRIAAWYYDYRESLR